MIGIISVINRTNYASLHKHNYYAYQWKHSNYVYIMVPCESVQTL